MGLVPGLLAEMIVAFFRSFKPVNAIGIKLLEFGEIVNPVGSQSVSDTNKLTPDGSAEPVCLADIFE